jgi:hypothetical protein
MGFLQIELKNNDKVLLDELHKAATQLRKDLAVETYKNTQNEEIIKSLRD